MKNTIRLLISLTLSSCAFAATKTNVGPWNGQWQGEGILQFKNGQQEQCVLSLDIESSAEIFFVKNSLFQCKTMRIKSRNPQPLQIRQVLPVSELWLGNLRLGTYSADEIHTRLQSADGRTQSYDLMLPRRDGSVLVYHDFVEWTTSATTEINGELRRVSNRK